MRPSAVYYSDIGDFGDSPGQLDRALRAFENSLVFSIVRALFREPRSRTPGYTY